MQAVRGSFNVNVAQCSGSYAHLLQRSWIAGTMKLLAKSDVHKAIETNGEGQSLPVLKLHLVGIM